MGAVHNLEGILADNLHPSWPEEVLFCLFQRFHRNVRCSQQPCCQSQVGFLVLWKVLGQRMSRNFDQKSSGLGRFAGKNFKKCRILFCGESRNAGFEDAGFGFCDFFQSAAQILHMVPANVGDSRRQVVQCGRRIPSTTHADFHQCQIHAVFRKPDHGHPEVGFEHCEILFFKQRQPAVVYRFPFVCRDWLMVDGHPFEVAEHMGRGKGADDRSVRQQRHPGDGASLAVGAGDLDGGDFQSFRDILLHETSQLLHRPVDTGAGFQGCDFFTQCHGSIIVRSV